jgi:transposase
VVPLLCTDPAVLPKAVLQAYKFQARLEKRFSQFKHVHRAAPLLFKKIRRVEANMFLFFIALLIQALLERELRKRLAERDLPPLKLYPEDREAPHPTHGFGSMRRKLLKFNKVRDLAGQTARRLPCSAA